MKHQPTAYDTNSVLSLRLPIEQGELAVKHREIDPEQPTIIFLHDALGCMHTWRDFPDRLAQKTGCNYLMYDRLGYGESSEDPNAMKRGKDYLDIEADRLIDLIEKLAITKPILFGHSDGGTIALIAASKSKNNIKGIIVEAAHIFVEAITYQGVQSVKNDYPNGVLKEKLLKYHGSKAETVFDSWANTWLNESFQDWNIESVLPDIICPCLIMQGEKDEYGSLHQVEGIKAGVQGDAKIVILENVGHTPHKEDANSTLKVTSDFIKQFK